jgi:GAF domain-containing protein
MTDAPTTTMHLRQLGAAYSAGTVSASVFLYEVCAAMRKRLACQRVSLWRFDGPPTQALLRCMVMHDAQPGIDLVGTTLAEREHADYFAVLKRDSVFESADTFHDKRLAPMLDSYLRPFDVRSLLDVAFSVNGQAFGVLSCEQVGRRREWQVQDIAELRRVGSAISLALARPPELLDPTQPLPLMELPNILLPEGMASRLR